MWDANFAGARLDGTIGVGRKGATIIMALHDINMAARFCDRIVALREGRLIADGQLEEIMTPDVLERIYGVRMDVIRQPDSGRPVALPR